MKTNNSKLNSSLITVLLVIAAYAVVAILVYTNSASRQMTNMLISLSCYIVLSISLNLVVGLLGELSLGHASFMSVGLFSGCFLSIQLLERFPSLPQVIRISVSMLTGGIVAAVFGLIVGLPALRLNGDYLAIVTLGCGEIIKSLITNLQITGGARGLDTSSIYLKTKPLLPYAFILVILTMLAVINLKNSKYGRAIQAIRDNKIAAESCGVNVVQHKLSVFIIAAFFAGAAGALYGHNFANMKAATFDYNMSIEILVLVVLGGMGSVRGSILAAVILKTLPEALRGFDDYRMLVYSVSLILIMLFNSSPYLVQFRERIHLRKLLNSRGNKKMEVNADGR